jgi:hypothetical protein
MSYANWLGDPTVSLPNNTLVIGGVPVNPVPIVVGDNSNLSTWTDGNFVTFFESPTLSPGTYLCGMEIACSPLTASNAGNGWNQGDYFVADIFGSSGEPNVTSFIRPYTSGIQVNATSPYNKGGMTQTASGIVILTSQQTITWQALFGKDSNVSYPQTRSFTITTPYYQKIA